MKRSLHNDVCMNSNPVISGLEEHRVILTQIVNVLTDVQIKNRVLPLLADEKGRLELKDGDVILCFWNLKDKEEFLVNLK